MPRVARLIPPNVVVHVISRFVFESFFLDLPGARAEYLRLASSAAKRSDWTPIHYAWMGTHAHWSFLTGELELQVFFQSLNTGFAKWVNRRLGRHGPVVANRPTAIIIEGDDALGLGSYIHNNPRRARVVTCATQSTWTSHRAYLGLEPAPPWLAVGLGFELMGLPANDHGRRQLAEVVAARGEDGRDPKWSGGDAGARHASLRRALAAPVEVGTPTLVHEDEAFEQPVLSRAAGPSRRRWTGTVGEILAITSILTRVSMERLGSRSRQRDVTAARKVCLLAWTEQLARPAIEMAHALGITTSAASRLLARPNDELRRLAETVATRAWRDCG